MRWIVLACLLWGSLGSAKAWGAERAWALPALAEQAALRDATLAKRLTEILPGLMRREGVDLWLLAAREYNDDPVLKTFLPATWPTARRRTLLLIHDRGPERGLETLALARYGVGQFQAAWDPEAEPDQWRALAAKLAELDPRVIAVNRSETFALADGLTSTEYEQLVTALAPAQRARLQSAERLAVGWLETRLPEERVRLEEAVALAHEILAEGLSAAVVTAGKTRTDELGWWFLEALRQRGLDSWFHPSVSVQRVEERTPEGEARSLYQTVIQPGDVVHVDFGLRYLGLHTDTQQMAYVLRRGETAPPSWLREAMAEGNRLQDLLTSAFRTGRTGNEILRAALAAAEAEGVRGAIYTHPLGLHGHAAGPTIGLWDQQGGVPGPGDYPLFPHTAYAIELYASYAPPTWGGLRLRIKLEEDAFFDGQAVTYLAGRQTAFHLIESP
jgi:Xaa-Pro aminopeptidase